MAISHSTLSDIVSISSSSRFGSHPSMTYLFSKRSATESRPLSAWSP